MNPQNAAFCGNRVSQRYLLTARVCCSAGCWVDSVTSAVNVPTQVHSLNLLRDVIWGAGGIGSTQQVCLCYQMYNYIYVYNTNYTYRYTCVA